MPKISNPFGESVLMAASSFGSSSAISPISHVVEPLDLSGIEDPSLQIIFKNLSKKDHENTKIRALEDLAHVTEASPGQEIEDGGLTAWMRLYPRLSVDLSKRVRQLTHMLHGTIFLASKKRVANFMPHIIGPWLCGTYDSDHTVAMAARGSLSKTFTLEKLRRVWEVYQADILSYCTNIIEREQVHTLSNTSQGKNIEESEAKFARVIGSCIYAIRHLLLELPSTIVVKEDQAYCEFFSKSRIWEFGYYADSTVRRAVYNLLKACLKGNQTYLESNLTLIAKCIIMKSITVPQVGSGTQYLETLVHLTKVYPSIWEQVKGKKGNRAIALLGQFISQGPQGALPDFWTKFNQLVDLIPEDLIPHDEQSIQNFFDSYVNGINHPTVSKTHAVLSWTSYFGACCRLLSLGSLPQDIKKIIIDSRVIPVYEEYVLQGGKSKFLVQGPLETTACVNGLIKLSPEKNVALSDSFDPSKQAIGLDRVFITLWDTLEGLVFSRVKVVNDPLEVPVDFLPVGIRWIDMLSEFHKLVPENGSNSVKLARSYQKVIKVCLENMERHGDKVPTVASLFEKTLAICPVSSWNDLKIQTATESFFSSKLPEFYSSPLGFVIFKAMLHWIRFVDSVDTIDALWTENIQSLLSFQEDNKEAIIRAIFRDFPSELRGKLPIVPGFIEYVMGKVHRAVVEDNEDSWSFTVCALKSQGSLLPDFTIEKVLDIITQRMGEVGFQDLEETGLLGKLEYIAKNHLDSLVNFVQSSPNGSKLLLHLLRLEGFNFNLKVGGCIASRIRLSIERGIQVPEPTYDANILTLNTAKVIVQAIVEDADRDLVPCDFLASKALFLFDNAPGDKKRSIVNALVLPDEGWPIVGKEREASITRLLEVPPKVGIDLESPLGGCVYLISEYGHTYSPDNELTNRNTFERFLRMALYTVKLLHHPIFQEYLDMDTRVLTILKLMLIAEVAKDNTLTRTRVASIGGTDEHFVSEVQSLIAQRLKAHGGFYSENGHSEIDLVVQNLIGISSGHSILAFYSARVLYCLLSGLVRTHGCSESTAERLIENLGIRNTEDIFLAAAFLLALSEPLAESKVTAALRNSLASDVSGITLSQILDNKVPPKLILLNSLGFQSPTKEMSFPIQRAMFLLRNILTWFGPSEDANENGKNLRNEPLVAEAAKLLRSLVPVITSVSGDHWSSLCRLALLGLDSSSKVTPMTYWCMKLYETLKTYGDEFEDVFMKWRKQFQTVLIHLFASVDTYAESSSGNICFSLLAQLVREIPVDEFPSMEGIYPLLRGAPKSIQERAYEILHQYIPKQQEDISVEAALASEEDEFTPQLAPELLSLVLETPSNDLLEDLIFDGRQGETINDVRGCFLAWRLIFDHFQNATFQVKSAYIANLQEGGYLAKLLDLLFEFLGIATGGSFEPERNQTKSFSIYEEDWTSQKSIKQLFVHLYYICLLNTPSLVKAWFTALTNRLIISGVEKFTGKYLSPLIIDSELSSVSEWASGELSTPATTSSPSDIEIQVRVSRAVREVSITCTIDGQLMELAIRLPAEFPLHKPEVEGIKKVGFTERQWTALQRDSNAVIALQGGSIIEAVMLFRKNVSLRFAGVEECAICYSILGQERTLPRKKCVTCANKFHAGCLFKWFDTSNSSTCPLCRRSWQFYGRGVR